MYTISHYRNSVMPAKNNLRFQGGNSYPDRSHSLFSLLQDPTAAPKDYFTKQPQTISAQTPVEPTALQTEEPAPINVASTSTDVAPKHDHKNWKALMGVADSGPTLPTPAFTKQPPTISAQTPVESTMLQTEAPVSISAASTSPYVAPKHDHKNWQALMGVFTSAPAQPTPEQAPVAETATDTQALTLSPQLPKSKSPQLETEIQTNIPPEEPPKVQEKAALVSETEALSLAASEKPHARTTSMQVSVNNKDDDAPLAHKRQKQHPVASKKKATITAPRVPSTSRPTVTSDTLSPAKPQALTTKTIPSEDEEDTMPIVTKRKRQRPVASEKGNTPETLNTTIPTAESDALSPAKAQARSASTQPSDNDEDDIPIRKKRRPIVSEKKETKPEASSAAAPTAPKTVKPYSRLTDREQAAYKKYVGYVENGNIPDVEKILARRPSFVDQPDGQEVRPLAIAASTNNPNMVRFFLKHPGVDLNAQDVGGYTAIMWPEPSSKSNAGDYIATLEAFVEHEKENPGTVDFSKRDAKGMLARNHAFANSGKKLYTTPSQIKRLRAVMDFMQKRED